MAIESGSTGLRRYLMGGTCRASSHEMWLNGAREQVFKGKKLKSDEENAGWAVFGNELSGAFALENLVNGKYVVLSLRRDRLRIPRTLLNLHCKSRALQRMKDLGSQSLAQKQKAEIKAEVMEELAQSIMPEVQVVQVLVDTARREVLVGGTSAGMQEHFLRLFEKSFQLKCHEADFLAVAQRHMSRDAFEAVLDAPGMRLDASPEEPVAESPQARLGSAFLTWMLHTVHEREGLWTTRHHGELGIMVDDSLLLEGEVSGSQQMLLKKGLLASCAELATSLKVGKQVSRVRLQVAREQRPGAVETWAFTIDKKNYDLAGVKAPKIVEADPRQRRQLRLDALSETFVMMDELLHDFLEVRYGASWKKASEKMQSWVRELQPAV